MPTRIVIASGNTHKAEEIQALLGDDFECRTLKDYPDAPEVEEDAATFAGNAVKKALSLICPVWNRFDSASCLARHLDAIDLLGALIPAAAHPSSHDRQILRITPPQSKQTSRMS